MKKPTLRIEEQRPRNIQRADIVPTNGYAMIVDGHFKTQFSDEGAAKKAAGIACELPNAESRSLRRFGEGPNTDKIRFLLTSMVDGRI
jgi:hypothetical protein